MNRKNTGLALMVDFLRRGLAIPVWLLILIVIAAILAPMLRVTIPSFVWGLVLLLVMLVGLLNRHPVQGSDKELSDSDPDGRKMRVSNFPDYANPTLLEIQDRARLLNQEVDQEEIGMITSVAGDLVFAVNNFSAPVTLRIQYTPDDEQKLREHREFLAKQNLLPVNVEPHLRPIYLHSSVEKDGQPATKIWKAFQNFKVDTEKREFIVEVSSWGDQPIGIGTKP